MKSAVTVLTHPTFNRPKVVNPVFRGKKRGCVSLGAARRKIAASGFSPAEHSAKNRPTEKPHPRTACAQFQQFETLLRTTDEEGARCMLMMLNVALEVEINRRLEKGNSHGK